MANPSWTKGVSGNPAGRASNGELFRKTLARAIRENDGAKLRAMVDQLIERAVSGDLNAIREVADRLDGKPFTSQYIELFTSDGAPVSREELMEHYNKLGEIIKSLGGNN